MTADDGADEMVKLNVKVPQALLDELDELATELEYPNRSEFVRAVLRETTEPILTPGAQERIAEGYKDVSAGRTTSHAEMKRRFGVEDVGEEAVGVENADEEDG